MNAKRTTTLLLALLLCAQLAACGGDSGKQSETTASSSADTSASSDTEPAYDFGTVDLKGDTFTILNTAQTYDFYSALDHESTTGETLDDSIYTRNRSLEERYKFKLEIDDSHELKDAATALQTSVLAGDDTYDIAFIRDYYISSALTEGYLHNLDNYPEFRLDQPWWNVKATDGARIGKNREALFALTDVSLTTIEGTMVTFINEDMLADLQLEAPYQLVLDGKWTFDKMCEYQKAGANLNGADAFTPATMEGTAIYGHTGFEHTYNALLASSGVRFIETDKDGNLAFGLNNENFLSAAIKLSESFKTEGEWLFANGPKVYGGDLFEADRALMLTHQLKQTNLYRDMDSTFGIVPVPKWDESQEDYVSLCTFTYVMCMPITNNRPGESGQIMDAMSYLTSENIMDYFYNGRLSQKQLRNEESIEMLQIVRDSMHVDIGMAYGLFTDIQSKISSTINAKSTDFASMVASLKPQIEQNIQKIVEAAEN